MNELAVNLMRLRKLHNLTQQDVADAAVRGGTLSHVDQLCFAMARDNYRAVWTSDKPLHTKCKTEGIPVF